MVAYHVDVLGSLPIGEITYSNIDYSCEFPATQQMYQRYYDGKLSRFGLRYASHSKHPQDNFYHANECVFEMVRRERYKTRPSRYQSFFAVETVGETETWRDLLTKDGDFPNCVIRRIEYSTEAFKADAYWRDNYNFWSPEGTDTRYPLFTPAISGDSALNYWSGVPYPDARMRRFELLIPLPVIVLP